MQESQEDSFEIQRSYYEGLIKNHPNWVYVDTYADHGISATSMKNRRDFQRLINDCKEGKIDLIITKSISRFARNAVDCIATCRLLKNLDPPVGVYFETENLNTLDSNGEMILTFLAALAQGESEAKSTAVKWGIRRRFAEGKAKIVDTYGFDRNGRDLKFNDNIKIVQKMYQWAEDHVSAAEIKTRLEAMKVPSPTGRAKWSVPSILYILTNEKYMGDILMQKTVGTDFLEHKRKKNTGQEIQYIKRNAIPAAITKKQWYNVQRNLGRCGLSDIVRKDVTSIGPWSLHPVIHQKEVK